MTLATFGPVTAEREAFLRVKIALLLLALLNACSSLPKQGKAILSASENQAAVLALTSWHMRAKLGFKTPAESRSAMFNWDQNADQYSIRLSGPFGAGAVQLRGNDEGVTLKQSGQATLHSDTASDLLAQTVGWSAPVEHLSYWVRGLAAPSVPLQQIALNEGSETIASLSQDGWVVSFDRYRLFDTLLMPAKIKISNSDLQLTVLVSKWNLDNTRPATLESNQ